MYYKKQEKQWEFEMPRRKSRADGIKYTGEFLGKRIHEIRIAKKISVGKLAREAGVSNVYIPQLERGEKVPGFDTFICIANTLEVTADELLCDYIVADRDTMSSNISAMIAELDKDKQRDIEELVKLVIRQMKKE